MNFVSPAFLVFLPVVLLLAYLVPVGKRYLVLLPASYLFYAWHSPWLLLLVLAATLSSYLCGRGMERAKGQHGRKALLLLQLIVSLGLLFVFKYLDFTLELMDSVRGFFGPLPSLPRFHLLLPMGISFYLFQTLSYVIDVYRGILTAEKHLGYYALYVVFFPQLVAGPIERAGDLLPQLHHPKVPDRNAVFEGFRLLVCGYAKKVLIADTLAPYVDAAYQAQQAPGSVLLFATLVFALQIYGDFSGYTDIARGCGHLLGVSLHENFNQPYLATSVRDFWRRWHMSLTQWFTDYVYIPLGGSRRGKIHTIINTLIVFLLSGLWHGADLSFVLWGLVHGLMVALERVFPPRTHHVLWARLRTFLLVTLAWVFFRADSSAQAFDVFRAILTDFRPSAFLAYYGIPVYELLLPLFLAILLDLLSTGASAFRKNPLPCLLLVLLILLARSLAVTQGHSSVFLYFQF